MKREALLAEIRAAHPHQCGVLRCTRPLYCKGLCSSHYRRLMTTGNVRADIPLRIAKYTDDMKCSVKGCTRKPYAKGKCQRHWTQEHRKDR